jgi:hypothetical protein
MVGKKEFPYSMKGMAMAKQEAKKSGKKIVVKKTAKKAVKKAASGRKGKK